MNPFPSQKDSVCCPLSTVGLGRAARAAPHHSEQATRQLQAGLIPNFPHVAVMNCLKYGFRLLETSQPENGSAATEVREEHHGHGSSPPWEVGSCLRKSRAGKLSHNLVGKHLCFSIILLTFCWDVSENLPTAHWISEVFKSATVGNAEVEALA